MFALDITPIVYRQASYLYKFTKANLAFQTNFHKKAIRIMHNISLSPENQGFAIPGNNTNYNIFHNYQVYQLNNIACVHMKLGKYNLASMYLIKVFYRVIRYI